MVPDTSTEQVPAAARGLWSWGRSLTADRCLGPHWALAWPLRSVGLPWGGPSLALKPEAPEGGLPPLHREGDRGRRDLGPTAHILLG